jgi:hypothetical protein
VEIAAQRTAFSGTAFGLLLAQSLSVLAHCGYQLVFFGGLGGGGGLRTGAC